MRTIQTSPTAATPAATSGTMEGSLNIDVGKLTTTTASTIVSNVATMPTPSMIRAGQYAGPRSMGGILNLRRVEPSARSAHSPQAMGATVDSPGRPGQAGRMTRHRESGTGAEA